jgi:hypothetical protein
MVRYERFLEYLAGHPEASEVGARLKREGADLHRVFSALVVYIEGRSVADERKKRGKTTRTIINAGVRQHGVSPAVGRWLLDRAELAHATNGLGHVQNLDSIVWTHLYLEHVTGRPISMGELAYLVQAALHALGRRPKGEAVYTDPNSLAHAIRRYRTRNKAFLEILIADISRNS